MSRLVVEPKDLHSEQELTCQWVEMTVEEILSHSSLSQSASPKGYALIQVQAVS